MSEHQVDLGLCPRCKDIIQPKHPEGYRSRNVDGVAFCVFCAEYIKEHPAIREKYVTWAKAEAKQ